MKIQTVLYYREVFPNPWQVEVVGSFKTLDEAIESCARLVVREVEGRNDVAFALFNDIDHPEMRDSILKVCMKDEAEELFDRLDETCVLPDRVKDTIVQSIRDEMKGRCYFMYTEDGGVSIRLKIIENELEGVS